jgi:hypothetical protein
VIDVRFTPDATKLLRSGEMTRCAISRHWDHRCDRASRGNEFTLALGLDFGLGGRILSGTEFCLTARNTASARLSSKRARTRIELAFRAKSILVERSRK